jgi:hypothetical protein
MSFIIAEGFILLFRNSIDATILMAFEAIWNVPKIAQSSSSP